VLGICALFNDGHGTFELARMAVAPKYQHNGYGQKLINSCLSKLSEISARKVYFLSNTTLVSAISLYKKMAF
jgi:N-acetylglutamate synthase-like GNAT family acetyltransferase